MFRRSRNSIRPIEIGRRLLREMDDHRSVDVRGERIVPNDFTVLLSVTDYEGFADIETALRGELIAAVREYAREEGYHFMGPVAVELEVDGSLKQGRFDVVSTSREAADGKLPGSVVLPSGDRVELTDGDNIVGRLPDCRVTIDDTNTSRHHARITRINRDFVVVDLGSTNGTYVNGERITSETPLRDGDTITVGKANLRFESN